MKKYLVSTLLCIMSVTSFAQVKLFDGSLDEAIARAKKENKDVIIMASTSWCGPCKALEKNVFTTKEAGDFINENYILYKRLVDKSDEDNIAGRFDIPSFPSFFFLNGDGVTFASMVGGSSDATQFIERIKKATSVEKSYVARDIKLKENPHYAMEYANFLYFNKLNTKAKQIIVSQIDDYPIKSVITKDNFKDYTKFVDGYDSELLLKLLANEREIKSIVGVNEYNTEMENVGRSISYRLFFDSKITRLDIKNLKNLINIYPVLRNDIFTLLTANEEILLNKNMSSLIELANKYENSPNKNYQMATIKLLESNMGSDDAFKYIDSSDSGKNFEKEDKKEY